MANEKTGRESDKFMLRFPDGMRDRIAEAAQKNGRSMNAEIIQALEVHFPPIPTLDDIVETLSDFIEITSAHQNEHLRTQMLAILKEWKRRAERENALDGAHEAHILTKEDAT